MAVTIYLEGHLSPGRESILLPLSSCAVLLITSYTHPSAFHLVFVQQTGGGGADSESVSRYVSIPASGLSSLQHEFITSAALPPLVGNVVLPAVLDSAARMVRSGLCVVVRHIVKVADAALPGQSLKQLLGFRQGSLRMCAEVSGWTKLCEVELPHSLSCLVHQIHRLSVQSTTPPKDRATELPADLIKLEAHFLKPPKVHNDDRRRRTELSMLQADVADPEKRDSVLQNGRLDGTCFELERVTKLPHGWKKFKVQKDVVEVNGGGGEGLMTGVVDQSEGLDRCGKGEADTEKLCQVIRSLNYLDIQFVHLYSEGVEMTIADLCLFSYFYFLLESVQFSVCGLSEHLPRVVSWLRHMITLPRLELASTQCGFNFAGLKQALKDNMAEGGERNGLHFFTPAMEDITEDDMELSRRCRTKHKAIKPEVLQALDNMKDRGIEPTVGAHPRGSEVGLAWDTFPAFVHPKDGEVPAKRVQRKCQQLENLVTAVMEVARPGDIIVDFCSGGGHLGIAIAYLLPQCTVYLVENKEESLAKAQSRMAAMNSDNIILYQCNLDYFVGKFDVGVCLHACGSATDMVLHQCLSNHAAFVICPCCYGSIQRTHLLTYPRSRLYQDRQVTYMEFLTLGHAADQTEFNIALEQQGRQCMNLVDSDRAQLARECGYTVTLTSLQPLACSPKNNLLIGQKRLTAAVTS